MINEQYKYSELTSRIIGCAMTVHKTLGNGFQELIYQRALEIEMRLAEINFFVSLKCLFITGMSKSEQGVLTFWRKV